MLEITFNCSLPPHNHYLNCCHLLYCIPFLLASSVCECVCVHLSIVCFIKRLYTFYSPLISCLVLCIRLICLQIPNSYHKIHKTNKLLKKAPELEKNTKCVSVSYYWGFQWNFCDVFSPILSHLIVVIDLNFLLKFWVRVSIKKPPHNHACEYNIASIICKLLLFQQMSLSPFFVYSLAWIHRPKKAINLI